MEKLRYPFFSFAAGLSLAACFLWFDSIGLLSFLPLAYWFTRLRSSASFQTLLKEGFYFLIGWFSVGCWPHALYHWWAYPFGVLSYTFFYWLIWIGVLWIRKEISIRHGLIAFVVLMAGWEYLQGMIEPFIPWFAIGNTLIGHEFMTPTFAVIGTTGITVVVMLKAIFLSFTLIEKEKLTVRPGFFIFFLILNLFPYLIPKKTSPSDNQQIKVAWLQPNRAGEDSTGHKQNLKLLHQLLNEQTDLLLFPENYFQKPIEWNNREEPITPYRNVLTKKHVEMALIGGTVVSNNSFFNAVIRVGQTPEEDSFRGKTKLIGGIEFPFWGTGYSIGDRPKGWYLSERVSLFPFVCIESIFGNFLARSVNPKGIITIHTNDVWFENSYAFQMHAAHARSRAQQLGKTVIRIGNSGISGIYYPSGQIETFPVAQKKLFQKTVNIASHQTFYSLYGDFVGRLGLLFSPFLLLYAFVKNRKP